MRVLVVTVGLRGHVHPTAPIAAALRSLGHQVHWATSPEVVPLVGQLGFAAHPVGVSAAEMSRRFAARQPQLASASPGRRRVLSFVGGFAEILAPTVAAELAPLLDELRPDLVLHDLAELASAPLAQARGIPHATVSFSGALPADLLAAVAAAVAPLWSAAGLDTPADAGIYAHAYLHPFPPSFGARPDAGTVHDIRPSDYDGGRPGDTGPAWLAGMGQRRPLVYLTAGTLFGRTMPWPVLLDTVGQRDVDAVVTVGPSVDPAELPVPAEAVAAGRLRVERYLPQSLVLPRARVVIGHGGAGTLLAAAAAGVPQLLLPAGADQFDNADAYARTAAGVVLRPEDGELAQRLGPALDLLLADASYSDRAAALAAEIVAMPSAERLARWLTDLGERRPLAACPSPGTGHTS